MQESEREKEVKRCLKLCYREDKQIMIDESMMRIHGIIQYIYDLIFFGNKIVLNDEDLAKIKRSRSRITYKLYAENCSKLIKAMQEDTHNNYWTVIVRNYDGNSYEEKLVDFLVKHPKVVYFTSNEKLYYYLANTRVNTQIKLFETKTRLTIAFSKGKDVKFSTLGFVYKESGNLYFKNRCEEVLIKAFTEEGEEKKGKIVKVDVGDIIFIRKKKDIIYSINLYKVVSNHSRNYAIHVIWTDLLIGEKTNFHIKRLEKKYQNIIYDNV